MAVTQNTYVGDGTTVLYSFTFPYLETTDILVSVDGVTTTAYTFANATTVQFNTAPANGANIRIYRVTDDATLAATFYPGSAIRSQDLNDSFTQILYKTQEVANYAVQDSGNITLSGDYTFTFSPSGPTPTLNSHLVTKQYVDSLALSSSVPDGSRGDITVSAGGTVWTLSNNAVTTSKVLDGAITAAKLSQAYLTTASAASTYAPLASPSVSNATLTGASYVNGSYRGNVVAVSALDIDCSAGNYFTKTITTGTNAFTVSNVPISRAYSLTLELTITGGSATFWSGVEWPNQTAPTLITGRTHLFVFVTDDGGARWRAAAQPNYTT
jgi:hypothetical protein